ncbi:MAG: PQQ-dependent sugar dehydrogenase [Alphaproteobacteria bacterium]
MTQFILVFLALFAFLAPSASLAEGRTGLAVEVVARGLTAPLYVTAPPNDARLFVVEQTGQVLIIEDGRVRERPFLNLSARLRFGGERGLLSLAFHPDYARNGYFFINYSEQMTGATRVERYRVSEDANRADPASARLILRVEQPYSNHNGGHILFGPDNMLYIAMGDGGSGGDPKGNGQNRATLLGALLRIDVDRGDPYAIPPDNPFIEDAEARPEIWAWGLRNPWRIAFDTGGGTEGGLLYVADVGQDEREEVTIVPASTGGLNHGWNLMEGNHCFLGRDCDSAGLVAPSYEYDHDEGCSITGGLVYRGAIIPALTGHYLFSDYCAGFLRSLSSASGGVVVDHQWDIGEIGRVTSFGQDAAGELYITNSGGEILKLVPGP